MANRVNHQEIVKQLLESKAVNFDAIGASVAQLGPGLALADEPWESFCGTMRIFIRVFILNPRVPGGPLEDLSQLHDVAGTLQK